METRHWRQQELYDGTYTLRDLLDYHEMMALAAENRRRMDEVERLQREGGYS